MLTTEQKVFIVQCYGLGEEHSYQGVIRKFLERWPNYSVSATGVKKVITKFMRTGSVLNVKKTKSDLNEEDNAAAALAMDSVRRFPKLSLRRRALEIGNISKSHLQQIYRTNKVKPFKAKLIHTLEENDESKRLDFCLWYGEQYLQNHNFGRSIIFSDESTFTTNGVVNSQNARYWSMENPNYRVNCRRQYHKKVNVWCAVSYTGIIGPYFFERNMNQYSYLEMLENILQDHLHNMSLADRQTAYFQHDGHPSHATGIVREWLDREFAGRWIGRYGPIPWPPRSPDLTLMDFYLWGYLKQKVYAAPLNNDLDLLKLRLREAIDGIPIQHIQNAYKAFTKRAELCVSVGGSTFE